jgi:hypothetical protein
MGRDAKRSRPARRRAWLAETLDGQEPLERCGHGQVLGGCGVQDGRERRGGVVHLQLGEVAAELLVETALRGRGRGRGGGFRCWHEVLLSSVSCCGQVVRVLRPSAAAA